MQSAPRIAHEGPKAVAEAAVEYDGAVQRYFDAITARHEAAAVLDAAQRKQDAAVQAASRTGAALPANTSIEKSKTAVVDSKRRQVECQNIAIGRGRSLARAVAAHAPEWRVQLAAERVAALDRLDRAAVELDAAVEDIAGHLGVSTWVARCVAQVNDRTRPDDLPAAPPRESVLEHDPGKALEVFLGWITDITARLAPVDEQVAEPEADAA